MPSTNIRLLQTKDYLNAIETGGLEFKARFSKKEINNNKFYLVKGTDKFIQLNEDYSFIDCRLDNSYHSHYMANITKEELPKFVERMIEPNKRFFMESGDSYEDEELELLGLDYLRNSTVEDYLAQLNENIDDVYNIFRTLTVLSATSKLVVSKAGAFVFSFYKNDKDTLSAEDTALLEVGRISGLFDSLDDLEPIKMLEKAIVKHHYNELHKLVSYLKANKEDLPVDIQDVLKDSLVLSLENLGKKHKGEYYYK